MTHPVTVWLVDKAGRTVQAEWQSLQAELAATKATVKRLEARQSLDSIVCDSAVQDPEERAPISYLP